MEFPGILGILRDCFGSDELGFDLFLSRLEVEDGVLEDGEGESFRFLDVLLDLALLLLLSVPFSAIH
jgi:hypothetical protein